MTTGRGSVGPAAEVVGRAGVVVALIWLYDGGWRRPVLIGGEVFSGGPSDHMYTAGSTTPTSLLWPDLANDRGSVGSHHVPVAAVVQALAGCDGRART